MWYFLNFIPVCKYIFQLVLLSMHTNCFQLVFPRMYNKCFQLILYRRLYSHITVCKYITYLRIVVFQHHLTGHDCQTRIPHETPCQRPVPHPRAVHCPFCTIVCSSGDLLLELVLTKHRDLCRGAKTTGDDDSSDKAGTMLVVGVESPLS